MSNTDGLAPGPITGYGPLTDVTTTPREDAIDALRVILTQEPDGSFAIEIEPGDGQRLLTAGADAVDAILNAQESWPELRLTSEAWVDLASPGLARAIWACNEADQRWEEEGPEEKARMILDAMRKTGR